MFPFLLLDCEMADRPTTHFASNLYAASPISHHRCKLSPLYTTQIPNDQGSRSHNTQVKTGRDPSWIVLTNHESLPQSLLDGENGSMTTRRYIGGLHPFHDSNRNDQTFGKVKKESRGLGESKYWNV